MTHPVQDTCRCPTAEAASDRPRGGECPPPGRPCVDESGSVTTLAQGPDEDPGRPGPSPSRPSVTAASARAAPSGCSPPAAASRPGRDQAMPHQRAADRRPRRHHRDALTLQLIRQPPRTPPRMRDPQLHQPRLDPRVQPPRMRPRPMRTIAQPPPRPPSAVPSQPHIHLLARHPYRPATSVTGAPESTSITA